MQSKIVSVLALLTAVSAAPTTHVASVAAVVKPAVTLPKGFDNSCGNMGYAFNVFENCSPANAKKPQHWDPSNMNTLKPDFSGTRNIIGLYEHVKVGAHRASVYGSPALSTQHVGIQHLGFFFAQYNGKYTVTIRGTDDAAYLYMGADCAHSHDGQQQVGSQLLQGGDVVKTITVKEGYYVPFEVRWANVMSGPYRLDLTIKDPKGNVVLGATEPKQNLLVSKVCNPNTVKVWNGSGLQSV